MVVLAGRQQPIHVLGAGAVGLLFASHLRRSGHPVTVLLRSQSAAERFCRRGGRIDVVDDWARPPPAESGAAAAAADGIQAEALAAQGDGGRGVISHLLVATKAQDTIRAFAAVRHRLGPQSTVALLQNGMGVLDAIQAEFYPQSQSQSQGGPVAATPTFIVGTTSHGCYRVPAEDFVTHHASMGACSFAVHPPLPGAPTTLPESAQEMADALRRLPLAAVEASWPDLHLQLLLKLAANAVINPTTALVGCCNGHIWPDNPPASSSLGAAATAGYLPLACAEIAAVYERAYPDLRSKLAAAAVEQHVTHILRVTARNRSSMMQDIAAGRATEVDWINGHLVRLGERHGVPTPINTLLCALVKLRETSGPAGEQPQAAAAATTA
ncbi:2-dehydropantoate 2-reductase (Ketopantoate reductase) (KPA reductase) (KPR) [Coemansia biformis]|uniref:2-dehydropantoate 2-reductase n=1 Tax=Coemansia biformis TaxID=1286918 RepID=A0A9W7YIT5_9FUNG|nr:2-dehydropantoate 2-reductase (Ketopantoate reductase) (KPA reductase) (KPR) [Coemansia biformis]